MSCPRKSLSKYQYLPPSPDGPNEYDKLQNSLFASFQHLNTSILAIGSLIILALTIFFFQKAVILDVLHLQRETAQILGLNVEKEQRELLWGIVLLTSTATALVGPMAFFGFMLANLTYLIVKDYRHKLLFIVAILVGFISLTLGQALIERVFALEIRISMIIESVGGAPILYLTLQEGASVKLENIGKSIQKQDILQGITLEVSPQKLTAFIGPNGAGKSTLLSIMSRLTKKDQGILSIKGREIESWNSQELAQELTILKQKINYQAKLTVEELVSFWTFSL